MQIRTLAAILAWIVVALLLLNGMIRSQLLTIAAVALTGIAVLLYFSPRWTKKKNLQKETESVEK